MISCMQSNAGDTFPLGEAKDQQALLSRPCCKFFFHFFPQNRLTHSLSPWSHPFTCGNSERGLTNDVEIFVATKEDLNTFFSPFSWAPGFGDDVLLN